MSENPQRDDKQGPQMPGPPMRMSRGILTWVIILGLCIVLVAVLMSNTGGRKVLRIDEFRQRLDDGSIQTIKIQVANGKIVGEMTDPQSLTGGKIEYEVKYPPSMIDAVTLEEFAEKGIQVEADESGTFVRILAGFLPWLLVLAFIWFFLFRQIRGAGGGPGGMLGNFGRSKHRVTTREHTHITFSDVAGIEEAKEECTELIEFLRTPKKFQRLGGRIPRGVLLVGQPGCGKTLLAKAIAGEADVPFFSISGSDFVEMFVGVGASRVRDLFKQAKENSPCIIFLDEIDAVGRRRGGGFSSGGHDEREQTLNAILVEMDGFETSDQVVVIAATNRSDVLDPALIRPGRFDRQVFVPLPDVKGRLEILKVHAKKIKTGPDLDLNKLARGTPMFSGADLAAIINEAALIATMSNKDCVEMEDMEEARDKVRWGRAKKSRVIDEQERVATAYHEAGHALVQCLLPAGDPLHKVSIIPRGPYGGATFSLPEKDRTNYSEKWVKATLRILCAGRIAEEMTCDDVNTGASADIRQASDTARRMVTEWGMSDRVGFLYLGDDPDRSTMWIDLPGGKDYSQQTAQIIDEEIRRIIDEAYADARKLLEENRDKLEAVAQGLLRYETLDASEVEALMRGESLDRPLVSDLLDEDHAVTSGAEPTAPEADSSTEPGLGEGPLPQPG